jgi:hypothetical protein
MRQIAERLLDRILFGPRDAMDWADEKVWPVVRRLLRLLYKTTIVLLVFAGVIALKEVFGLSDEVGVAVGIWLFAGGLWLFVE